MKRLKKIAVWLFEKLSNLLLGAYSFLRRVIRYINKRKILYIPFYGFLLFVLYITLLIQFSGDGSYSKVLENKRINDVTQINPIHVNKIIKPTSVAEIQKAILGTSGHISIGGGKFSMGGQTAFENSLHLDMRSFNKILDFKPEQKRITVQPGVTWRQLQDVIDPHDLSIKIMQTYANFTVGGSISVNCHGRYVGHGPIISSVMGIKLITADGELITANRDENQEIFNATIGGYGGIGVIVEVTLELADNLKVERRIDKMPVSEYYAYFEKNIKTSKKVVFQNGDLYPPNYDQVMNISWEETDKELTEVERMRPIDESYWLEHQVIEVVSWGKPGKWVRRNMVDPLLYRSEKVVWRNNEASYNVLELEPSSREKETYVLQEYFIPVGNIESFIPKMRAVYDKYKVDVINVSLRHAYPDNESYLSWAREEVFAFVIYYQQKTSDKAKDEVRQWTQEMTDAILSEGGTWYLPYQPHATVEQFNQAYPNATKYFDLKNKLDSTHRFTNKLLDKYNPYIQSRLEQKREEIVGYNKPEEQSVLSIPEWYLVFNPKEYAEYLELGNNPSAFPFYASIDEYWKLYDRSIKLASEAYPENAEYITMLQIIGVSVTMEYGIKMIYENTIGRFFGLFAEESMSAKEETINQAHRAYSNFIYHTAWYEFEFLPWIGKVWSAKETSESSFLRRWERTLFFTVEFSFKAFYAQLLEWAAQATYEPPITVLYMQVSSPTPIGETKDLKVILEQGDDKIISATRWGPFTEVMKELSLQDITIEDIAGNDEIFISVVMQKDQNISFSKAVFIYDSRIVTNSNLKRMVYQVPVGELLPFIRYATANNIEVEHIYDY